jgi:membrane protease YdiL (CAAX protease family)
MLSNLAGGVFVVILFVGVPLLSLATARRPDLRRLPQISLYLSAILSQGLLTLIGIAVMRLSPLTFLAVGFRTIHLASLGRWTLLLAVTSVAGLAIFLVLERHGWWPPESELVELLIPETRAEKLWAVLLVAPMAGICEEFLYRGYLLTQLTSWLGSPLWAWVLSSLCFGLGHVYQGAGGILRSSILGALLGLPVLRTGSLYPSMAAHFLIDAVALTWLGPRLLRREPRP